MRGIATALPPHIRAWFPHSNAVGYKAEKLRFGFTMATPTFVNVSNADNGVDLYDLVPSGKYAANDIAVQTLNFDGTTDKNYSFTRDRNERWFWKDIDTCFEVAEGDVTFKSGDGLWISGVDEVALVNSGAVSTDDNKVTLRFGFTATGNMTAVALDLYDLVPDGVSTANAISIQTLNYDGTTDKNYSFTKDRNERWFWKDIDTGFEVAEGEAVFKPGQGLWIDGIDGASIVFPGPTL